MHSEQRRQMHSCVLLNRPLGSLPHLETTGTTEESVGKSCTLSRWRPPIRDLHFESSKSRPVCGECPPSRCQFISERWTTHSLCSSKPRSECKWKLAFLGVRLFLRPSIHPYVHTCVRANTYIHPHIHRHTHTCEVCVYFGSERVM